MASRQGDDVERVTMEGEHIQEEEEEGDEVETDVAEQEEEQEVVDIDAVEEKQEEEEAEEVEMDEAEQREEHEVVEIDDEEEKQQDEEDEVVVLDDTEKEEKQEAVEVDEEENQQEADEVIVLEDGASTQRSRANTNALMAANGIVTPARLEEELQCIICQYALFKPVSALCGHSFCRVCLMDSFLTRPIEEAQCPICRVEILQPFTAKSSLASLFAINVTLWNLAQLLIPSVAERVSSHQQKEEEEFSQKLDQLNARWKVFTLSERAARYHGDHDEDASVRWEDDHEGHEEYPVVKVEETRDGNLVVERNVVLDTNDENEDGVMHMRVGLCIMEFPSVFELYNEHQECSLNIIKVEEDEEMADGMPFFMNEDGDDDGFVCSSYYNEISLHVCDEAGNCVMERTRGAQGGVVTFPGLRLDVPSGMYTFRFSDDLYGLKLSITTRLREPHEISDTPVADFVSLIHDEARDADRRGRGRRHDSDNEDASGDESDDSFIVDDLNGEPVGSFSDDEGHWQYHEDDEAADELREQRRIRRRQRSGRRRSERDVQIVDEGGELSGEENEHEEPSGPEDADEHEHEHEDEDEEEDEVRPGRRNVRLVEEAADSSDGEGGQEDHDEVEEPDEQEGNEQEVLAEVDEVARARRRNANQIVDSEDEDEGASGGSDNEQKENDIPDAAEGEHGEIAHAGEASGANEDESDDNEQDTTPRNAGRKVKREQWFHDEDDSEEEHVSSPLFSPDEDAEVPASRPRKRARGQDRQVRVIDVAESDEEQEQMERSIMTANSAQDGENASDEEDSDSQFQRVHQLFDEEVDERHEFDDDHDYPDEEIDNDENEDY